MATWWRQLFLCLGFLTAIGTQVRAESNDYGRPDQTKGPVAVLDGPSDAFLRPYYNGAGPAAIFRYGRDEAARRDVFGIVDPVTWRIQFFALEDWTNTGADKPLSDRITWGGACKLPPTYRFWRVHQWPGKVILQLQPEPLPTTIQNRAVQLRFPKVTLDASPSAVLAAMASTRPSIDDTPGTPCGDALASNPSGAYFGPADAATDVDIASATTLLVKRRTPAPPNLKDAERKLWTSVQALSFKGRPVVSAQELEEARAVSSKVLMRHVLVTARSPETPGMTRTDLVLYRTSPGPGLTKRMILKTGLSRVKAGQRMVAVSSVGEVLVIGAADNTNFHIRGCYFTKPAEQQGACIVQSDPIEAAPPEPASKEGDDKIRSVGDRDEIWARASDYLTQRYDVVADGLPPECRSLARCKVNGATWWSPLTDLRRAEGVVRGRRGAPYGQIYGSSGKTSQKGGADSFPLGQPYLSYEKRGDRVRVFGDIENTSLASKNSKDEVFGIDCSTFVSRVWGLDGDMGTKGLVLAANKGEMTRIDQLGNIRMNDALVIRLEYSPDAPAINHIVLYRERRDFGPLDKSQAVMVLEASSACGGTCVTLYDESFFDGWGIVSASPPNPKWRLPRMEPLEIDYGRWKQAMGVARAP